MEKQGSLWIKEGSRRGKNGDVKPEVDAGVMWLLSLKVMKGAKECGKPLETIRNKEKDLPLEPPEEIQSCQQLDFSPVRVILDFWPLEI